jgi:hypothetical protein
MTHPGGRPSKYRDDFADEARKLAKLGATDLEIADFFDCEVTTIYRWKNAHPEFRKSLEIGKEQLDARVESSLYHKAVGFEHPAVKVFQYEGAPVIVPYTEYVPPDTASAIIWLKNRQPEKWRDKIEHEFGVTKELADLIGGLRDQRQIGAETAPTTDATYQVIENKQSTDG